MARNVIPFPEPAQTETERLEKLYAWADGVLQQIGIITKIAQARTTVELQKIRLDLKDAAIILAIRAALEPADGSSRAKHFARLREGGLCQIIKARFNHAKK